MLVFTEDEWARSKRSSALAPLRTRKSRLLLSRELSWADPILGSDDDAICNESIMVSTVSHKGNRAVMDRLAVTHTHGITPHYRSALPVLLLARKREREKKKRGERMRLLYNNQTDSGWGWGWVLLTPFKVIFRRKEDDFISSSTFSTSSSSSSPSAVHSNKSFDPSLPVSACLLLLLLRLRQRQRLQQVKKQGDSTWLDKQEVSLYMCI